MTFPVAPMARACSTPSVTSYCDKTTGQLNASSARCRFS